MFFINFLFAEVHWVDCIQYLLKLLFLVLVIFAWKVQICEFFTKQIFLFLKYGSSWVNRLGKILSHFFSLLGLVYFFLHLSTYLLILLVIIFKSSLVTYLAHFIFDIRILFFLEWLQCLLYNISWFLLYYFNFVFWVLLLGC